MNSHFSRALALLRQEKGVSQRSAAKELGISQALLSHYEKGVREPGLVFVAKACDYYHVSADFLLGRTLNREGAAQLDMDTLPDASMDKDNVLRGSVMATLYKKLLVNSLSVLFDLLGKLGKREVIKGAAEYLSLGVYKLYRHLYRADGTRNEDLFPLSTSRFLSGLPDGEMAFCELEYTEALADHLGNKGVLPDLDNETLTRNYPGQYQSLLQVVHTAGERMDARMPEK